MTEILLKFRRTGLLLILVSAGAIIGLADELPLMNTQTISMDGLDTISIHYGFGEVILRESATESLIIKEYMNRDRPRYYATVSRSAGTLQIRRKWGPWLFWLWKFRAEIYLPRDFRGNLNISHSSGDLHAEADILNYKTIDTNVSSGSVMMNRLSAETVSVRVASGSMDVRGIEGRSLISISSGRLQIDELSGPEHRIKSSSGRTRIGVLRGGGSIEVSSGAVAIDNALGRMDVRLSSGSLSALNFSGEGIFNLSSGTVNLDVREMTGDLRFKISSGSVNMNIPGGLSFNLDAVTRSGTVEVQEDGREAVRVSGNSTVLRPFGLSPARTIYAQTSSGKIVINRR
jgi:DUF4097 and DUF4098 domain-containing protein YvlB